MDYLILAVGDIGSTILTFLTYGIIIRAVLSWFQPNQSNPFYRILIRFTDPVLHPIQRIVPTFSGLDLSPIAAIFALQLANRLLGGVISVLLQAVS